MVELIQKFLKDEIRLEYGKSLTKNNRKGGEYPVYGSNGIVDYNNSNCFKGHGVIIGRKGTVGSVKYEKNDFWAIDTTYVVNLNDKNGDLKFWYYFLQTLGLENMNSHSAVPGLNRDRVYNIKINIPKYEKDRRKISKILSFIDSKIELNNRMNDNLYEILETLYKNELIVDSEKNIKTLDEYCNIFTGKKNANEYDENGKNIFFTCGEKTLKINSYIYDGTAIIISGNGSYTGRTIFYDGKFDLYQRTYACTVRNQVFPDYIYCLYIIIKKELTDKIKGGTHGSAIPYIVMNDLAKFKIIYTEESMKKLAEQSKLILNIILHKDEENKKLEQLRDKLLPKLMNGEIDLAKIKI